MTDSAQSPVPFDPDNPFMRHWTGDPIYVMVKQARPGKGGCWYVAACECGWVSRRTVTTEGEANRARGLHRSAAWRKVSRDRGLL